MRRITLLLSSILALALSGCVPNGVTYYLPSAAGGQVREAHCVPTKSLLDFTVRTSRGGLPIRALANDGSFVHQVALFPSKGSWESFRFSSTDFRIYDRDKQVTIIPAKVRTFSDRGMEPLTTEPYGLKNGRPAISEIQLTVPHSLPANFDLLSPSIVIDGEEVEFPTIHFERKLWLGISPFNC